MNDPIIDDGAKLYYQNCLGCKGNIVKRNTYDGGLVSIQFEDGNHVYAIPGNGIVEYTVDAHTAVDWMLKRMVI